MVIEKVKENETMNKIEQMIHDLCPEGVKRVRLGEVGSFYSGLSGKSKKDFEDGNAKFITYKNVYSNPALKIDVEDTVKIAPNEKQNTIQYGDILFTGSSETPDECAFSSVLNIHTEEKLYLNSFCFGFRFNDLSQVNIDFYKHYFRCLDMRKRIAKTANGTTRFNVSKKDFAQLEIPLPPLEIQGEIVKILDRFAVLTAELEARRKQYEYYRTRLLSFDSDSDTVQWRALGEIGNTSIGLATSVTKWKRASGIQLLHNSDIAQNKIIVKNEEYLDPSFVKKNANKILRTGDIITVHTGDVGTSAIIEECFDGAIGFTTITTRLQDESVVRRKYLCHYLNSPLFKKAIEGNVISDRNNLNLSSFEQILIPIPPLAEQERIVNILDKFDQLVNGVKDSIPELIDKVQKQYEYYRNKLLTFPEA